MFALALGALGAARMAGPLGIVSTVLLFPLAWLGLHMARTRVGIEPFPYLARGALPPRPYLMPAAAAVGMLVAAGVGIPLAFALAAVEPIPPESVPFAGMAARQVFLANLQVVLEEGVFRVGVLWAVAALFAARARADRRPDARAWAAIGVTGVLFALAHVWAAVSPWTLTFVVVQKGLLAGGVLGYLAWRWGVESAVLAHFAHNMILVTLALAFS